MGVIGIHLLCALSIEAFDDSLVFEFQDILSLQIARPEKSCELTSRSLEIEEPCCRHISAEPKSPPLDCIIPHVHIGLTVMSHLSHRQESSRHLGGKICAVSWHLRPAWSP